MTQDNEGDGPFDVDDGWRKSCNGKRGESMTDWSKCPAVESVPGRVSGAWVFKGTRLPVSSLFENLESGSTVEEYLEWFDAEEWKVRDVLQYVADSLKAPVPVSSRENPV